MTIAQEIAALQEQCKVLEGDRDPTARAALLHKRAEIKRLQRQVGQAPLPQDVAPEVKAAPDPEPEPEPPPAKGAAIGPRALTDEQRQEIMTLAQKGMSGNAIARRLGYVAQATVSRILCAERAKAKPEAQNSGQDQEVLCDGPDLTQQKPSRGRLKVSVAVYMDTSQFAALKSLAKRTRVPYAEYVRRGVDLILADPTAAMASQQPQAEPTSAELRCLEWLAGRMEVWGPTLVGADNRQMVTEMLQRVHAVLGRGGDDANT